jgi:hypothetical protein
VLLDTRDRPGHVLITGPGAPELPRPAWKASEPFERKATVAPSQHVRPKAVLPFMKSTGAIDPSQLRPALPFPEPSPKRPTTLGGGMVLGRTEPPPAEGPSARRDTAPPPRPRDEEGTFVGAPPTGPTLPFTSVTPPLGVPVFSSPQTTSAPTFGLPPSASAPAFQPSVPDREVTAFYSLPTPESAVQPFSPAPEIAAPVFSPAREATAPAPVFVLESASSPSAAPEVDPDLDRIRLVQQAIWRADRPTRQVLAEHGLTEVEWRAMKRASARKA